MTGGDGAVGRAAFPSLISAQIPASSRFPLLFGSAPLDRAVPRPSLAAPAAIFLVFPFCGVSPWFLKLFEVRGVFVL